MARSPVVPARFSVPLYDNLHSAPIVEDLPLEFLDTVGLRVCRSGLELVYFNNFFVDPGGCIRGLSVGLPPRVQPFFDRVMLPGSNWWLPVRSVPFPSPGGDGQKQSTQNKTHEPLAGDDGATASAG